MMADLISRAAAIDAVYYKPSHKMAIEVLKEVPAVDAALVVFCKDCKYYNTTGCGAGFGWCEDTVVNAGVWDNFYCADGERRESE